MYHQLYFLPPLSCFHAHLLALSQIYICISLTWHFCLKSLYKNTQTQKRTHTYKYSVHTHTNTYIYIKILTVHHKIPSISPPLPRININRCHQHKIQVSALKPTREFCNVQSIRLVSRETWYKRTENNGPVEEQVPSLKLYCMCQLVYTHKSINTHTPPHTHTQTPPHTQASPS